MIVLPRRLSDEVADRVRALIDEKNLEAGMKLPAERQLAMQLGVSTKFTARGAGETGKRRRAAQSTWRRDVYSLAS